jgi:hypothetical protein
MMRPVAVLAWSRSALLVVGLGFTILFLFLVAAAGFGIMLGTLALLILLSAAVWRWPGWGVVALAALTPVNRFVILLVFHLTDSRTLTTLVQLWKDALILVLCARGLHHVLSSSSARRIRYLDILLAPFLVLALVYVFVPPPDSGVGLSGRIIAFRADAFFLLAYFVGRAVPLDQRHISWLLLSIIPGTLVVSMVAVAQFAWPGWFNHFSDSLGFQQFILGQGGFGDVLAVRSRGIAGFDIPRASSLLLGDLALAFYQVMMVAIAGAFLFEARREWQRLVGLVFLLVMVATLALTVTRSALLVIPVVLLTIAVRTRAIGRLMAAGLLCAIVALFAALLVDVSPRGLAALTSPDETSIRGHLDAAERSVQIIREFPLGRGLGSAGTIGQRLLGAQSITNEDWYLQLSTEMGVVAGALYLLISTVAVATCFTNVGRVTDRSLRILVLAATGAGLGFLLMGFLLHVWEVPVLSMLVWLLIGIAVSGPEREMELARNGVRL